MSASFYDLMKYARTGIASPSMTAYDKQKAQAMFGGKPQTLTGVPPLSFKANGTPLISWSMLGNGQQTGTPTPDNPVMPEFVGVRSAQLIPYPFYGYKIPITCAGQTVPVYLGQTQTVRRVKKLVLTGEDGEWKKSTTRTGSFYLRVEAVAIPGFGLCDRAVNARNIDEYSSSGKMFAEKSGSSILINLWLFDTNISLDDFKSYLAAQYAAGTPVTVWYVLATPETGIVNEPLAKIGEYADELHSTDAGVTIPTVKGDNALTVDTDLQPSSMAITGNIKPL